jgi:hypothetical protein
MGVTTTNNKPFNPRGNDQSPKGYNRASLFSGKALDFDGVNDSIDISNFSLNGYTAFSVCFYKTDDFNNAMIFSSADSISDGVNIYQVSPGYFRARLNGFNTDTDLEVSTKKGFFVLTYDGLNLNWYYQAQNIGSSTTSRTFAITNTTSTIGRQSFASTQYLNGQIAGFKIFNTALTAEQVADLYNNPEKVVPTGLDNTALKLWLPMMEGAGTTAYDGSGNGNHGTISGATYVNGIGAPVAQSAVMDWNKGVNLLYNTENFASSGWAKLNSLPSSGETGITAPDGNGSVTTRFTFSAGNHIIRQYTSSSDTIMSIGVWVYIEDKGTGGQELQIDWGDGTGKVFDVSGYDLNTWYLLEAENLTKGSFAFVDISANPSGTAPNGLEARFWGAHMNTGAKLGAYIPNNGGTQITSEVLLPQGLTTGRDITGVNLFENVRKQGALNLDGNSWAEVHKNDSIPEGDEGRTLECWFFAVDRTHTQSYMETGNNSGTNKRFAILTISSNIIYIAGQIYDINTGTLADLNAWNHVVVTHDGSTAKVYKNGSLIKTVTGRTYTTALDTVSIGRNLNNVIETSNGAIAQPRIYNRALTASEVLQNYNAGKNTYTN